ncbi:unnamed protein product [Lymnaea stagnalis]|uniref:Ig-like domain-containing protein n=1 Tax=Lymnaea stagnalis TaxID=6523 RepID=A0AAV2GZT7_LYMST
MKLFTFFYLVFCSRSVQCALPLVDKTAVVEGEPFTIVCDHLRCDGIPKHVNRTSLISILKINPNTNPNETALAYISISQRRSDVYKTQIPDGRNWKPSFHSENHTDNIFSINVTLTVMDTRVEDSGQYMCRLYYMANEDDFDSSDCSTSVWLSVRIASLYTGPKDSKVNTDSPSGERTTKSEPRNHGHFIFTREIQEVFGLYFICLAAWLR